ncbi:hypothetical protein LX73_2296 [Fodinibius salinus]|uniref:Uncharacterized protein n=1 Tax=Fodinibius salinus TaxID=860790 RepID=A0A5D3YII8_9BACT|nr:hypothetical protein [Fodinibius salinus]TYP92050.1 hypothetical protein LX73_2296 [Fodinibius salinus]
MITPKFKTPTIGKIIWPLAVSILIFFAGDYLLRQPITNQTAVVAVRTFASPQSEDDSIYMIVLVRDNKVWKTHVSRSRFYDLQTNDRLLLTRYQGLLTGYTYNTTLPPEITLKPASELQ